MFPNTAAMKILYAVFKIFFTIGFLQITQITFAQKSFTASDGLGGESIINSKRFEEGDLGTRNFTVYATGNGLYYGFNNENGLGGTTFDYVWGPPKGTKIKNFTIKRYENTDAKGHVYYTSSSNTLVALLDNGDVYKIVVDYNPIFGATIDSLKRWGNLEAAYSEVAEKVEGDALYTLSSSYLYISTDSSTWHIDSTGLAGAHINDMTLDTLQRLYAATSKGLFTQDTSAITPFTKVNSYTGPQNLAAVYADRHNRLYISVNGGGVYISTTNGATWQIDTAGLGATPVGYFSDDVYGNIYCIAANGNGNHLYKSAGGNQPWQLTDSSIYNQTINLVTIYSVNGDSVLSACTSFGIFLSADKGKTWIRNNKGIRSENITGVAKTPQGKLLFANALGINKKTGNATWAKVYPQNGNAGNLPLYSDGLGSIYTIDNTVTNNFAVGGAIFKTTDEGNTWSADTLGLSGVGGSVFFVDEKGTQHIGNSYYAGTKPSQLWAKPKGGAWAIDTVGFPVLPYSFVYSIASDKAGYLYATGFFGGKKLMRRSITGTHWCIDTAGIPTAISYFNTITGGKGDLLGTTNTKVYHRGSGTWSAIALPAQATFPTVAGAAIDTSGYIFVALNATAGAGVYFTSDLGAHWKYAGLDSANVSQIVAFGDTAYVLTRNQGAFALTHNSILPVTLSTIKAYGLGKGIQVEWSGYNEINMLGYDVERSANGNQFIHIGNVAARGNSVAENTYTYFDASPSNGDNFYRIKATSKNGTVQYSGIVKVNVESGKTGMLVYPNPAVTKTVNIQLNNIEAGKYSLIMYNTAGQRVYTNGITHAGGNAAIAINAQNMAPGVYWLVLQGKGHVYNNKVVVE